VSRRGGGLGAYFPDWMNEMFFGRPKAKRMSLEDALSSAKKGRQQLVDVILPKSFVLKRALSNPPRARRNWRNPRVVTQLRESTVNLPNTVWLNEWTYNQGSLRLAGEVDGSAADLVLTLSEKVRGWSPALSGAVSSTPDGNQRFELAIAVERGGQ